MAKKKNPKPAAETTVELHLPPNLYASAKKLYDTDKDLFSELVRAVFSRDDLYGITTVKLVKGAFKATVGKAPKGPKKVCDVGGMP